MKLGGNLSGQVPMQNKREDITLFEPGLIGGWSSGDLVWFSSHPVVWRP